MARQRTILLFVVASLLAGCSSAPKVEEASRRTEHAWWTFQWSGTTASLRGLSAVDERVAWVSGTGGTFRRTTDGGVNWDGGVVPGAEELDFRDVHAIDAETAWLLSAGEPARIYRTDDGGATWTIQYENRTPGVFFDAMEFWSNDRGIAFSDPIRGRLLVVRTRDAGATWEEVPEDALPPALAGEHGFAASGTCLAVHGDDHAWIGTGGSSPRIFYTSDGGASWQVTPVPFAAGESSGVFSIAFRDALNGIAVGGDYQLPKKAEANACVTEDGGKTWRLATTLPRGFRSTVHYLPRLGHPVAIAAGDSGSDYTVDGGWTWRPLRGTGWHAIDFAPGAACGWAVGTEGRVVRIDVDARF